MSNPECNIQAANMDHAARSTGLTKESDSTVKLTQLVAATLKSSHSNIPHNIAPSGLSFAIRKDLGWLRDQNNPSLYQLVEFHIQSEPWRRMVHFRDMKLLEQVKLFFGLLESKGYREPDISNFIARALGNLSKDEALIAFALLTYHIDRHPECTHDVNFNSVLAFEKKIADLDQEIELFTQNYQAHAAPLRDEALSVELPNLIAKMVLTSMGEVNFGLIPLIEKHFSDHTENYFATLIKRLNFLYEDAALRAFFPEIKVPQHSTGRAVELLQILNDLPRRSEVTDRHAQHAALAAFLSHIRQISPNGCFAFVVCQSSLENNPKQCLEDFQSLIRKASLTRKSNHVRREYSFLMTVQLRYVEHEFKPSDHSIAESLPLRSACLAMGVTDAEEKISKVALPKTGKQIIEELAGYDAELALRGCLAYEFRTRNGLLTMWHNCIAGMSEGKVSSMITSEILQAVIRSINADYPGLDKRHLQLKEKLEERVVKELLDRMCLIYDPSLKHDILGNGGFVLYDQSNKRIDTLQAFRQFLVEILDAVAADPLDEEDSATSKTLFQKMIAGLKKCINSDPFIDRLLENYMDQKIKAASKNLDQVLHTPWITHTGNSTETTLSVYLDKRKDLKSKIFKTVSAENLLDQLQKFYEIRRMGHPIIAKLKPARVLGLHAFNMIPLPVHFPGLEALKVQVGVDGEYQSKMVSLIKTEGDLDKLDVNISERTSLNTFRDQLLQAWNKASPIGKNDPFDRERQLDTLLICNLPLKKRVKLMGHSIPIADSNLSANSHDIYFYCFHNPFSKKIELWKMGTDFSEPTALNPKVWLNEQTWEIFYL